MGGDDNPPTLPIFTALASVLAAIENGATAQAEVEWNRTHEDDSTEVITVVVYRHAQPRFGTVGGPPQPEE